MQTWTNTADATGDWSVAANWDTNTVPNGSVVQATITSALSTSQTVLLNENITLNTLTIAGLISLSSGLNTLTFAGAGASINKIYSTNYDVPEICTITCNIVLETDLTINIEGYLYVNGSISGNHTLTINGTAQFSGGNTVSNVVINSPSLVFGDGNPLINFNPGAMEITNTSAVTIELPLENIAVMSTVFLGLGSLTKNGLGTLTLTGNNTLSNLIISSGEFNIGDGIAEITNFSPLTLNVGLPVFTVNLPSSATSTVMASNITGTSMTKIGAGSLTLIGDNALTSKIEVTTGELKIGNGFVTLENFLPAEIQNNSTSPVVISPNFEINFNLNAKLSGSGVVKQTGSGTVVYLGSGTSINTILIESGRSSVSRDLNSGNYLVDFNPINIINNSNQPFNIYSNLEFPNLFTPNIAGTGEFQTTGPSPIVFSGICTATGILRILGGALTIANMETAASLANSSIINNSSEPLVANVPINSILSLSELSGSAGILLVKTGAGTLIFTGTSDGIFTVEAGTLVVNGTVTAPLSIPSGATLKGSGTVSDVTIESGGNLAVGNSPGLLTVTGDLILNAAAIFEWELTDNSNSTLGRGVVYDAVDVSGNVTIDAATQLKISVYGSVNFLNSFWTTPRLWNMIQASGTISNSFTPIDLLISGISQAGARAPAGEFFAPLVVTPNRIMIDYVPDAGAGGDPHITTIHGEIYTLPNIQKSMEMYNNGELKIETQMRCMPWNYWKGADDRVVRQSTYMHQTKITMGVNELVLGNHTLEVVVNKGCMNYTFTDYFSDSYQCYGKIIPANEFRAKILTVETEKLSQVKILFVKLKDDTIINDMRLMANPSMFTVPASGALVSIHDAKWGECFFYRA